MADETPQEFNALAEARTYIQALLVERDALRDRVGAAEQRGAEKAAAMVAAVDRWAANVSAAEEGWLSPEARALLAARDGWLRDRLAPAPPGGPPAPVQFATHTPLTNEEYEAWVADLAECRGRPATAPPPPGEPGEPDVVLTLERLSPSSIEFVKKIVNGPYARELLVDVDDDEPADPSTLDSAAYKIWSRGNEWRHITQAMSAPERNAFADAVDRHAATISPDPTGFTDRWWNRPDDYMTVAERLKSERLAASPAPGGTDG